MNDDKTATMRKPAKLMAKADMLGDALIALLRDARLVGLTEEDVTHAYCFGFRQTWVQKKKRLPVQFSVTEANFYMTVLDTRRDLSREQWFFLLRAIYIGAGLKAQADKAEVLFKDQLFGDLPFGRPSGESLRLV